MSTEKPFLEATGEAAATNKVAVVGIGAVWMACAVSILNQVGICLTIFM